MITDYRFCFSDIERTRGLSNKACSLRRGEQTHHPLLHDHNRMDGLPLVLYLTLLLESVLSSLPAPVIVNVTSVNFHHVLHWDPGPGTPAGTQYKISRRVIGKENMYTSYSNTTSLKLRIPGNQKRFILTVQASYNQTLSQESKAFTFSPWTETIIGPPKVSLAGCGNCIRINISLPEADPSSRIKDIHKFYNCQFSVYWRKHKGAVSTQTKTTITITPISSLEWKCCHLRPRHSVRYSVIRSRRIPCANVKGKESAITPNKTYTVTNLQIGTEYCVQVHTRINTNRNTKPSAWNCTFTSIGEPSRDPVFLGAVAGLLMIIGFLMSSMFCLHYTGFICKRKATLPPVLIVVLSQDYTLIPERTIPDKISIGAETEKQKRHHNPPAPQMATRDTDSDEEDEEEKGENVYMDRDAELSSGESSCQDSVDVSGNSKVAVSGGSRSSAVQDTEFEVEVGHGGLDQNGAKAEGIEVSFMPEGPVTVKVEKEEEKEEEEEEVVVCESFGNINLFSVTLAALAVCEEEEGEQKGRESVTDFLKLSDLEPQLPTKSERTLNHTDSQTESDDWTTVALMLPTQEYFTEDGYEARRIATSSGGLSTCDGETQHDEAEEEEEEEEFSGYMGHT